MERSGLRPAMALYGLAYFGIHLAFIPLFVLLLPRRVEQLAPDSATAALSLLLLAGGIVAALAHILAGHWSDGWLARKGSRRGLIALGLAALSAAYLGFALARSLPALMAAVLFFQLALNLAFAPLGALLADYFPDQVKGQMSGLMNAALPASSLAVVLAGWTYPEDSSIAFLLAGGLAIACLVPLVAFWPLDSDPAPASSPAGAGPLAQGFARRDFTLLWVARLLVQLGATFILGYIYLFLNAALAAGGRLNASEALAWLSAPAAITAIVATLAIGWLSDRIGRRRLPLAASALLFAGGLALLATASNLALLTLAYVVIQASLACFLSIDTAAIAQIVAGHGRRGYLLGVMNLTNTLPAVLVPALTLLSVEARQIGDTLGTMLLACALGSLAAALLVARVRTVT